MISKKLRGVTFVELIIAMLILSFMGFAGAQMIDMFAKAGNSNANNYDIQNTTRVVASTIKTAINNASSIFLLNESAFLPKNRTDGWNYIGVESIGNYDEIVQYIYNGTTKTHDRKLLGRGLNRSRIGFMFNKLSDSNGRVEVIIVFHNENNRKEILLDTSFESLNASTVVDWSSGNGSSAFAYRNEALELNTDTAENLLIGFALDVSSSMKEPFGTDKDIRNQRTYHLRNAITKILNPFMNNPNVWVTAVAYEQSVKTKTDENGRVLLPSNGGMYFHGAHNLYDDKLYLKNLFDPEEYVKNETKDHFLKPYGTTNSGDGLRCIYYQMLSHTEDLASRVPSVKINNNVLILITDGENNFHTIKKNFGGELDEFYFNKGFENEAVTNDGLVNYTLDKSFWIKSSHYNGYYNNYPAGPMKVEKPHDEYMYRMGKLIKDSGRIDDAYFVALAEDVLSLNTLGTIFGYGTVGSAEHSKHVFSAKNVQELDIVVATLIEEITMSFENIIGPKR